jgi:hypothetical protein
MTAFVCAATLADRADTRGASGERTGLRERRERRAKPAGPVGRVPERALQARRVTDDLDFDLLSHRSPLRHVVEARHELRWCEPAEVVDRNAAMVS